MIQWLNDPNVSARNCLKHIPHEKSWSKITGILAKNEILVRLKQEFYHPWMLWSSLLSSLIIITVSGYNVIIVIMVILNTVNVNCG